MTTGDEEALPEATTASLRLHWILALAGTLPFAAGALLTLAGTTYLPVLGPLDPILQAYGLTIAAFMAGALWGQDLALGQTPLPLLMISNVLALTAWAASLALPGPAFELALTVIFIVLLLVDVRLWRAGTIAGRYLTLRAVVTTIVCAALLVRTFSI